MKVSVSSVVCFLLTAFSLQAAPRPAWPPWPENTLSAYRFNDIDWHPPLRPPAIGFENAFVQESWSDYALIRDGLAITPVAVPSIDSTGQSTFAPGTGAVRFWFSPNWTSVRAGGAGPGYYARLLELVDLSGGTSQVRWSLYVGEKGDTLYFSGPAANTKVRDFLKVRTRFVAGEWNLITLNYSPEGSQLWLGDQLVARGGGAPAPTSWQESSLGLIIGSDLAVTDPANGLFEELTTFDYWPGAEQLQFYYDGVSRQVVLGAVGSVEEEAVKQELLAAEYPEIMLMDGAGGGGMQMAYSYSSNELWLEITGASNGVADLIVHTTEPWVSYEIQSRDALTNAGWLSETYVLGVDNQDWTPAEVIIADRTNALFFRARSFVDDDGDGLPSWWELENGLDPSVPDTGNTGVSDGYKDSDNDGWSNLQEYQNGTNPGGFNTPPAPQGIRARLNPSSSGALVTWVSPGPAVLDYIVENDGGVLFTNSSPLLEDSGFVMPTGYYSYVPQYRVQARYTSGNSTWSEWVDLEEAVNPVEISIVAGSNGPLLLALNVPQDAQSIDLWSLDPFAPGFTYTNVTLAVTPLGGSAQAQLPSWAADPDLYYWFDHQLIRTNGTTTVSRYFAHSTDWFSFADGREQLLENLVFKLRAASIHVGFSLWVDELYGADYKFFQDYVHAGYLDGSSINEWHPFEANYNFRNCVYDAAHIDPDDGWLDTGFGWWEDWPFEFILSRPSAYEFLGYGDYGAISPVLSPSETTWLHPGWSDGWGGGSSMGITLTEEGLLSMATNKFNHYGLPFLSSQVAWVGVNPLHTFTINAGGSTNLPGYDIFDYVSFYPETEQPIIEGIGYYFGDIDANLIPGDNAFATTNTSPLLIASVGNSIRIAGFAKLSIINGYADKFAYLGQYFDKAYKANPNGTPSTNETGFLSPYGEFLPTEPGRTILTTLPDGVSTNVGECMVHVISLNVDANHDGEMDRTLTGLDQTSENKPFEFWVNNDNDVFERDSDTAHAGFKDYDDDVVGSERDLEDFARLWISGLPAMPAGQGFAAVLKWQNVTGSPAIRLFRAYESDGGTGYLTDTNVSLQQFFYTPAGGYGRSIGRVAPTSPMGFSSGFFADEGTNSFFLFEAAGVGSGELVLIIAKDGETIAETSVWLDFQDASDLYERAHIKNVTSGLPPSSLISTFKMDHSPEVSADETSQLIVFVHGINNTEFAVKWTGESMFKRLYWSGYNGRFAVVRWPCAYLPKEGSINPAELLRLFNFNKGEFYAFKSAAGLGDYLHDVANRLPGYSINLYAHSQGAVVASEAVSQGAPFDNMILSQGAVPAHSYDEGLSFVQKFLDEEATTPTPLYLINGGYHGCFTNIQGNVVNFHNTNDYALATGNKVGFDTNWEANHIIFKPENFAYVLGPDYYFSPGTSQSYRWYLSAPEQITDVHEIRSMVARTRTKAVGSLPNLTGVIENEIDLAADFEFGLTRDEHSAQFTRSVQNVLSYYQTILVQVQPAP